VPDLQPTIRMAEEMGEGLGAGQVLLRSVQKAPRDHMKPITFACRKSLPLEPEAIANQILDLAKWPDFRGYGPIPGIKSAEFDTRTADIVGSRIRVTNLDGSTHIEEIVDWQPDNRLQLLMKDFSLPLSRLATSFVETWDFERINDTTMVLRSFEMNAKSRAAWPILWLISFVLKRAIDRHLHELSSQS
jgi:hypothetical protein